MASDMEEHCWLDVVPQPILEIYRAYDRPRYVGINPAVIAIDMYEKAYAGGPLPVEEVNKTHPGSCGVNAWNAIPATQRLFKAARRAGIPIIHTTGVANTKVSATNRKLSQSESNTFDFKAELAPLQDELVIRKNRASAFFGTPLIAHLRQLNIQSLIICGESTSGCVRASAVDAYSYAFHTVVVEDCVFDRSILSHKFSLFDLHHKYADVMRIGAVLDHLNGLTTASDAIAS